MPIINLVCWHCGKSKSAEVSHLPQFAFEIGHIANQIGMYGAIDFNYDRALVFCNKEHANMQRLKNGHFRQRPKKIQTSQEQQS